MLFKVKALRKLLVSTRPQHEYYKRTEKLVILASKSPFYSEILLGSIPEDAKKNYEWLRVAKKCLRTEYYEEIYETFLSSLTRPRLYDLFPNITFMEYFKLLGMAPPNFRMAADISYCHSLHIANSLLYGQDRPPWEKVDSLRSLKEKHRLYIKLAVECSSEDVNYLEHIPEKFRKDLVGLEEEARELFKKATLIARNLNYYKELYVD